jgi:DNA topoisomerase-3
VGAARNCDFRSGTIILQQPIERAQMAKLLTTGKTDLLTKFVSKKNGRTFKAFLALGKDGKIGFEFEPRAPKAGAAAKDGKPKEPPPKLDFTGQESLGVCPKCKGKIFQSPEVYICENSQRDTKRCTFKLEKIKNGRPIDVAQLQKLLKDGRTDLLDNFISRAGKPFSAHLILEGKGKIGFEFAPRDS